MGATGDSGAGRRRRGRGRGRGRPRGRGRGRGRPRKAMVIESDDEEQIETSETVDNMVEIPDEAIYVADTVKLGNLDVNKNTESQSLLPAECDFDIDDDISQLVPPRFTTISKGPPQPMLELEWNQRYTPIAERLPNPNIHMCDMCRLPIRIYGRMIPCKHVFCHSCSLDRGDQCPRCTEKVHRIEKNHIGTLFMCVHEGTQYGYDGCRRTYLSQRDLQAHINHRHKPRNSNNAESISNTSQFHSNATRAKADSQSQQVTSGVYGSSPETSTPTSSTGPRYDRDRNKTSYPQHTYQRPNSTWPFRQY